MPKTIYNVTAADKELSNLTFKNLQREVIKRGMPFEDISKSDYNLLASWFTKNFSVPQSTDLLRLYDIWLTDLLNSKGVDKIMTHPQLGYSYLEVTEEEVEAKSKPKSKVKSKVKTDQGIMGGTKKAMTYELATSGKTKQETIDAVLDVYPEASLKSLGIWYNKALKEQSK